MTSMFRPGCTRSGIRSPGSGRAAACLTMCLAMLLGAALLVPGMSLADGFSKQGVSTNAEAVSFCDAWHGYATGGGIWKTADGGRIWEPMTSPLTMGYAGISCVGSTLAWVCGDDGVIGHTSNGVTWVVQASGTTESLGDIDFADASHGWACGSNGTIVATIDGGASWTTQDSGVTGELIEIDFVDRTRGWAVGVGGEIIATVNGGSMWTRQSSGTAKDLYGVHVRDATHGWVCGAEGLLLQTQDGGLTWTRVNSGTSDSLYTVAFGSPLIGWVGSYSWAYRTDDGGTSWILTPGFDHSSPASYSSSAVDDKHCWLGGEGIYAWDTNRPTVKALKNVRVKRGKLAPCWFRVNDATAGFCGTVRVTVKTKRGKTVAAFKSRFGDYATNSKQRFSFKAKLPKGKYKWFVAATDWAGNPQKKTSWKYLTVR